MVKPAQFRSAATRAVRNIVAHGDTDIFPFPIENLAFSDMQEDIVELILEYDKNFDTYLTRFSPRNVNSLTPVSYSGFRWATQIDPIWNAHFLTCVLALTTKIERTRPHKTERMVFSYRYSLSKKTADLFDRNFGWFQFMNHSIALSKKYSFVVICDIAEFYSRLGHHRIENALMQIAGDTPYPKRIMSFLANYSNTRSFGLPIGGPASRILSELTINQIDQLLIGQGVVFTRFADDYHIFADTREAAYRQLVLLSEMLFTNQGLSLQKSKTRIMTSIEFRATNPLRHQLPEADPEAEGKAAADAHKRSQLLRFSLRFDPYSPTRDEDFERLKREVRKFDIISMLKEELAKSRVHTALARKVVAAIRFLEGNYKDNAVRSLLNNNDVLYPIFSSVLLVVDQVFDELSTSTQRAIIDELQQLIENDSYIFRVDVHLSYGIRLLARSKTGKSRALLQGIYERRSSPLIRRGIILAAAKLGDWYWLSNVKNAFRELSGPERTAFIVASYTLKDEGRHWRRHIQTELSLFEKFMLEWAGKKAKNARWVTPI